MRFSFRSRRPIPELHLDPDATVREPLDRSDAVQSEPAMTDAPFVDEAAEMERLKVNRQREVQERKFS
jgi:hypothetical protein